MSSKKKNPSAGEFPGGPVVRILLPLQGARVRSLIGDQRSHIPRRGQKKPKKQKSKCKAEGRPRALERSQKEAQQAWCYDLRGAVEVPLITLLPLA